MYRAWHLAARRQCTAQRVAAWIGAAATPYEAALVSGLIVAWQAGRVSPAEALRYE